MESIGLISGTGPEGCGIALRLAQAGVQVQIGSRSEERAQETAERLNSQLGKKQVAGTDNGILIHNCGLLFLTVPFPHAAETLRRHERDFTSEQVLIDVTVPLSFQKGPQLLSLEEHSGTEHLRKHLPDRVPLVATFKTLPAHFLAEIDVPLDCDEFICWDSLEAKERVLKVVQRMEGIRWLEAGPLKFCRALEGMTLLAIGMNRRYRVKGGRFRMVGL